MNVEVHPSGSSGKRLFLFASLVVVALVFWLTSLDLAAVAPYNLPLRLGGAVLLVVSSAIYVLAPLFSGAERLRARAAYGSHRDVVANTATAIALGNIVFLPLLAAIATLPDAIELGLQGALAEAFSGDGIEPTLVFLALVGLDMALLLVVYLRSIQPGATSEKAMGLVSGRLTRNLGLGLGGVFMILMASAILGLLLNQFGVRQTQAEELAIGDASPTTFLLLLAAGAVLAPLAEEIFFRGYVFRSYLAAKGPVRAYIASSLLFASLHLNLAAFVPLFVIGLILAFLYHRSGSLVPSIIAHALNNGFALIVVYYASRVTSG